MNSIIVDCSTVASMFFEDEESQVTERILNNLSEFTFHVPSLWPLEVCNVLRMAEKRKRIDGKDIPKIFRFLNTLPLEIDSWDYWANFDAIYRLAEQSGLTSYDATYIELALRRNMPLATLDKELLQAAKKLKLPTL